MVHAKLVTSSPARLAVVQDDRDDGRQGLARGLATQKIVPDAEQVPEQPQGRPGVDAALVFVKHIEQPFVAAGPGGGEEQVGVTLAELLVDKGAGADAQLGPGDARHQRRGQAGAQDAGGVGGVGKHRFKQRVVRTHRLPRCHGAATGNNFCG